MKVGGAEAKLGVIGCRHTTEDVLEGLVRLGFIPDHCVTLRPGAGTDIPGRVDVAAVCNRLGIAVTEVARYGLAETDREAVLAAGIELLLVVGWGRLIPGWWLEALSKHAYSVHGAARPLPYGRGRSPVNWTIVRGERMFFTQLFRLRPGVDDGPVVGVLPFEICEADDALTVHLKNTVARLELYRRHLPAMVAGTVALHEQPDDIEASWFPKRLPEDNVVHWDDSATTISNLIRGLAQPHSGAVTYLDDDPSRPVRLWRAVPCSGAFSWPAAAVGEIVQVFFDRSFLVKTGDAAVLVRQSEPALGRQDEGRRLGHLGLPRRREVLPAPTPGATAERTLCPTPSWV